MPLLPWNMPVPEQYGIPPAAITRRRANLRQTPGKWVSVSEKIQLYIDTCYRIGAGEQITFRGYLNPIDTTGSSYGRLMRSRGMSAKKLPHPRCTDCRTTSEYRSAGYRAAQVQYGAVERIMRLDLSEADRNLVATLVAGERRGIDPKLRNDYAVTGVAHILSVSGLHMGFVLVIANLLLGWIVLFRRGHLIKKRTGHPRHVELRGSSGTLRPGRPRCADDVVRPTGPGHFAARRRFTTSCSAPPR